MAKRVCWKKGMRLTDEILRASDNCMLEYVGIAFSLATAGRFGLLPSSSPFEISLNIANGVVDVERLSCLAIARGGDLIDVHYDTKYTNTFETRVAIPDSMGKKEYILTVNSYKEPWKETNDGYEVPVYSFSLISVNSPVPEHAFPIAHVVDENGWRMDDVNFVPPCLFITSHPRFLDLQEKFRDVLKEMEEKARRQINSTGKDAIRIFWPIIQQIMITVEKECDLMTPIGLLANVQKCVSAFTCACDLDESLDLADADRFRSYIYSPYNYKDSYLKIQEGLDLCYSINEKVGKLKDAPKAPSSIEAPTIANSQLVKRCTNSKTNVQVSYNLPGATVYYSTDGSEPTKILKGGQMIPINSGFNSSRKREPDKIVEVKLKAVLNGVSSSTNSYEITLKKDIDRWNGIEI